MTQPAYHRDSSKEHGAYLDTRLHPTVWKKYKNCVFSQIDRNTQIYTEIVWFDMVFKMDTDGGQLPSLVVAAQRPSWMIWWSSHKRTVEDVAYRDSVHGFFAFGLMMI